MGAVARRIEADPFAHRRAQLRLVSSEPQPANPSRARRTSTSTQRARGSAVRAPKVTSSARTGAGTAARVRARKEQARARALFSAFLVVFVCVVALGGVRVALLARAAEASITEGRVQAQIKAQRAEAGKLEVDRSSLSTPSRIAGIASETMQMGEPASVRYISLQAAPSGADAAGTRALQSPVTVKDAAPDLFDQIFGVVTGLQAAGAQSLVVGDSGLARSR